MSMNPWLLHHMQATYEREKAARRTMTLLGVASAGAAVGAVMMALFTSRRGRRLRSSVANRAQHFVNPFLGIREEVTRPEPLARIAADERLELAAKVRALNDDDIDVDSGLPMHRDRGIV